MFAPCNTLMKQQHNGNLQRPRNLVVFHWWRCRCKLCIIRRHQSCNALLPARLWERKPFGPSLKSYIVWLRQRLQLQLQLQLQLLLLLLLLLLLFFLFYFWITTAIYHRKIEFKFSMVQLSHLIPWAPLLGWWTNEHFGNPPLPGEQDALDEFIAPLVLVESDHYASKQYPTNLQKKLCRDLRNMSFFMATLRWVPRFRGSCVLLYQLLTLQKIQTPCCRALPSPSTHLLRHLPYSSPPEISGEAARFNRFGWWG